MIMFKPTALYVKTHNKTGYKYKNKIETKFVKPRTGWSFEPASFK